MTGAPFAIGGLDGWRSRRTGPDGVWHEHAPDETELPTTGVKLHVTARVDTAAAVLERAVPVLVRARVAFKHAASPAHLARLGQGAGGLTQIGKFLTAYPADPASARTLAHALHDATTGLSGPRLRSEAQLVPGSLVHARFGAFAPRFLQQATGQIVAARVGADGRLEPDDRADATLPAAFGATAGPLVRSHVLRGRFLCVERLHEGPRSTTWLALDQTAGGDLVAIKEAGAHRGEGSDGADATVRLAREAALLRALEPTGMTPAVVDHWDEDAASYLAYRFVEGPTLGEVIGRLAAEGLRPPASVLADWTEQLCVALGALHERGLVLGDLKPGNVIVTAAGLRLIDLETAAPVASAPRDGMATRGYAPAEQRAASAPRAVSADVHAAGATLLAVASLMDAAMLPDLRAVAALEARRDPGGWPYPAIRRCLDPDPAARFPSVAALRDHVRARRASAPARPQPGTFTSAPGADRAPDPSAAFADRAVRIGDLLLDAAVRAGDEAWWCSPHPVVLGQDARDLYAGTAGTALVLCRLHADTGAERFLDAALAAGRRLWSGTTSVPREVPMPGLYYGECGPGLVYLALAAATGDPVWTERALTVGAAAADTTPVSPDLMTGAAGTGLFQLALWRATGDPAALAHAEDAAAWLAAQREPDRPLWRIPAGHGPMAGTIYLGLAHGAAGVGAFFAALARATGDPAAADAAAEIADELLAHARPGLADGTGLTWPRMPGTELAPGVHWCHGAAGIARVLLAVHGLRSDRATLDAAEAAGRFVAAGAPWAGTTQCHGLAGTAETLVDLWQHTGDPAWLDRARALGANLAVYGSDRGWPSDAPDVFTPDLMVGQAGVAAAFLRLARPDTSHIVPVAVTEAPRGSTRTTEVHSHA